ncbi:hypothetical protein KAFR_0F04140 [Kazachstania africana CBS 2517]|uniref:Association with the SNF1 complex (ASC) domain-containing protein n=1 Tax=Kazachstania africana (strain ATCC 22294 / BCRC 22015 / CBS 2517 / CECT 1963 / NBRC 1671 / NRRL Y-8276) TaxID=1071382 RepID=H2AXA9_KAZAF|nr:hypothetical protein KAFR_0F04140 [Kazachstania africana CBS 2517]CCF59009.1 hypothetical protein KAFR_0F04140 [Kazachstania africana CBS 2517]
MPDVNMKMPYWVQSTSYKADLPEVQHQCRYDQRDVDEAESLRQELSTLVAISNEDVAKRPGSNIILEGGQSDSSGSSNSSESVGDNNSVPSGQMKFQSSSATENMVPVEIIWKQGGKKVYVTGSFTSWRKMIALVEHPTNPDWARVRLKLPPGNHRFRFVVDNELRFSDDVPSATDSMGNLVNYIEVKPSKRQYESDTKLSQASRIALKIKNEPDDIGDGFVRYYSSAPEEKQYEYSQKVPALSTDPKVMEQYYIILDVQKRRGRRDSNGISWLMPPQIPPHFDVVILNDQNSLQHTDDSNAGFLPIPNHVVLNHLIVNSVKSNMLAISTTTRYKEKFITQVCYSPID